MALPRDGTRRLGLPGWLAKINAARYAAYDALTKAEKAEAAAAREARRERVRARRAATLALARRIFSLHDSGHSASEIAALVGRRPISVISFAADRGVFISRGALVVRRAVLLTREREDALRRMAEDYGTAAAKALDDLLTFLLDDDAAVARRILHVKKRRAPDANPDSLARRRDGSTSDRQDARAAVVDGSMGAGQEQGSRGA
jgi:hypothetical protein